MKVSTDGILLGAWSKLNENGNALDIGAGTGLIALMLAQRTQDIHSAINIAAVEIDEDAAKQATTNILYSPWAKRIELYQQDINEFAQDPKHQHSFSTIVSNPPYFSDALQGQSKQRNLARHNEYLPFAALLKSAAQLSTDDALFSLILPVKEAEELLEISEAFGWYLSLCTKVSSVEGKTPNRYLMTLKKGKPTSNINIKESAETLSIRDKNNNYSDRFKAICKAFYLKF